MKSSILSSLLGSSVLGRDAVLGDTTQSACASPPTPAAPVSPAEQPPTCSSSGLGSDNPAIPVHMWTNREIQLLIDLRISLESQFNSNNNHTTLWNKICRELAVQGINVTDKQASNKWKALKSKYKKTVDHNKRTGEAKETCPFYETFDVVYGNKASTNPQYLLDSEGGARTTTTEGKDETEATPKRQKRPTVTKSSEETPVKLMKTLVDQNAQIIGVMSQQHDDRMAKTDRLLGILSQLVNK